MSHRNKRRRKGNQQKKYEDRPLTSRPFARYFKHIRAGQDWIGENLPEGDGAGKKSGS